MNLSLEEITSRADALYEMRAHLENVCASLQLLEQSSYAKAYEVAWRLGRALFFLGQEAQSAHEASASFARGATVCEQAVQAQPLRVEGHFWLGVNLALLAQGEKPLRAVRHALRASRSLKRAAGLDPSYHGAGPLRVLARLQQKLPRLLGGGITRARANFERALKLAPANPVTRLYFAELLLETGDKAQASKELQTLLALPHDSSWAFELARDREIARRLLEEL